MASLVSNSRHIKDVCLWLRYTIILIWKESHVALVLLSTTTAVQHQQGISISRPGQKSSFGGSWTADVAN